MIVFHVAITTVDDYASRREPHRRDHLARLQGLRAAGILVGGGPAPDGKTADLFYRLQQPGQLKHAVEEDPYWRGGAWTRYEPRSFAEFVEPWAEVPLVLDGSRRVTIVEGPVADHGTGQLALVELRGAGRLAFGGFFGGGRTLAVLNTPDAETAFGWLAETGSWARDALTARPYLYVL